MNSLRQNTIYALLSITLLSSLVSLFHPERGPAMQAMQATRRYSAATAGLAELRCLCGRFLISIHPTR